MVPLNIFENIEKTGYIRKEKKEKPAGHQSSDLGLNEEALRKEFKEDSIGKIELLEIMIARIVGCLTRLENGKIIDEIVGEQGASKKLAKDLMDYWELLGNKKILPEVNSAKETLTQVNLSLNGFIERAKNPGKFTPTTKEIILNDFNFLKEYLNLLKNNRFFEKAELETADGFLVKKIGKKNANLLRGNRNKYMKTCKEILEPPINNNS